MNTRDVARCCETDCGSRRQRREGPNHIVTPYGVCDVSHHVEPELVIAMVTAATASYRSRARRQREAIETTYRGTMFRSRLEARWACFLDLLEWEWVYEPFDGNHYIPDFALLGDRPVLVEVRPALSVAEFGRHAPRVEASIRGHWDGDYLIVGASPVLPDCAIGWLGESYLHLADPLDGEPDWKTGAGCWVRCRDAVAAPGSCTRRSPGSVAPAVTTTARGTSQPPILGCLPTSGTEPTDQPDGPVHEPPLRRRAPAPVSDVEQGGRTNDRTFPGSPARAGLHRG